jgi:dipeptidyl aminopeptidase/acylaminoacyl peptidase
LKELGVETELIVYPRGGHGINERKHKLDQKNRSAKWILDRLLG